MKLFSRMLFGLVLIVFVVAVLYAGYDSIKKQNTIPDYAAISPLNNSASTTPGTTTPTVFATSTADTSSWKTFASDELGYELKYPSSLQKTTKGTSQIFTFPKNIYFHWPLQDDARITVTTGSSCPSLIDEGFDSTGATTTFMLNGYAFSRYEGGGAAAGNRYRGVAYDTAHGGICYHLSFFDHSAAGAGLYVDDPSLIARYDAEHDADLKAALDIFNAMTQTFRIRAVPDGALESDVSH